MIWENMFANLEELMQVITKLNIYEPFQLAAHFGIDVQFMMQLGSSYEGLALPAVGAILLTGTQNDAHTLFVTAHELAHVFLSHSMEPHYFTTSVSASAKETQSNIFATWLLSRYHEECDQPILINDFLNTYKIPAPTMRYLLDNNNFNDMP